MDNRPDIPGLSYFPDFVSEDVADTLLRKVDSEVWSTELKRRVQHYGYRYDYKARAIHSSDHLGPLPDWLNTFITSALPGSIMPERPDQIIANEYLPGKGISAHIDCVPCFGETITSLSLASATTMVFTHSSGAREEFYLQPRSLIVLSGEARFKWRHAIPARKSDMVSGTRFPRARRVSLTFRKVPPA